MIEANLKRTLILPESDGVLAAQLFQKAVDDLDVVLFVVLGKPLPGFVQVVDWRARALPTRQVVWVLNPGLEELAPVIAKIRDGNDKVVAAVYSKTDRIVVRLTTEDDLDPLSIETAFSQADAAL